MTPNLFPLYLSCFAMIGLLAGFARYNKRAGWMKKRNSLFQDLVELQTFAEDLEGELGRETEARLQRSAPTVQEITAFTSQLSGLNGALKQGIGGPVVEKEPVVAEMEHAAV